MFQNSHNKMKIAKKQWASTWLLSGICEKFFCIISFFLVIPMIADWFATQNVLNWEWKHEIQDMGFSKIAPRCVFFSIIHLNIYKYKFRWILKFSKIHYLIMIIKFGTNIVFQRCNSVWLVDIDIIFKINHRK